MKGRVFSIEEFATFDGPGVRMSVFLKGCPLACSWCHNPEGKSREIEYMRSPNGCTGCGKCLSVGNGKLTADSIAVCPRNLVRVCGVDYEPYELVKKIGKNATVLAKSGGGVTFSGGEPLSQHEFLCETLDLLNGKVHTAVQTSGFASESVFDSVLKKVDYVLMDLKVMSEEGHLRYCGVDNTVIKKNYVRLANSGVPFITRVPLIPGVTDTEENLTQIAGFIAENGVKKVELLPYNRLAGSKYAAVLKKYSPDFDASIPPDADVSIFEKRGIESKIM